MSYPQTAEALLLLSYLLGYSKGNIVHHWNYNPSACVLIIGRLLCFSVNNASYFEYLGRFSNSSNRMLNRVYLTHAIAELIINNKPLQETDDNSNKPISDSKK